MRHQGITFTVYGRGQGVERIMPFDPMPRVVPADEWERIERGLEQRVRALNLFVHDIYHDRLILKDRVLPPELVLGASGYRPELNGVQVPHEIYLHVSGIDLIRDPAGTYLVLEDNARTPSGVSYVLKNRQVMKQVFPFLFEGYNVRPIDDYASNLLAMLRHIAPVGVADPTVAVLTPGLYNSAYFEHSFLAAQMGIELVEGRTTWWWTTATSTCGPRAACSASTCSTAGWTTISSIRSPSAATATWAWPGVSASTGPGTSPWPTAWGRASATTRASTPSCLISSATTSTRTPSWPTSRRSARWCRRSPASTSSPTSTNSW